MPPSVLSVRREPPDGSQNLPQQIPATRQPSETAAGPESRLLVSDTTWRAFSFPQVAIPETTRSCPGEEQFQAAFRFQTQDLIATTDAIPWQDLQPWLFRKWQEGKQGSSTGHAAAAFRRLRRDVEVKNGSLDRIVCVLLELSSPWCEKGAKDTPGAALEDGTGGTEDTLREAAALPCRSPTCKLFAKRKKEEKRRPPEQSPDSQFYSGW